MLVALLTKSDLALVFVLQLLFIGIVYFLVNNLLSLLLRLRIFVFGIHFPIVVFYHHDSTLFVVPSHFGLLANHLMILVADEEGFRKGSIQHHDKCSDSEEAWEVSLFHVVQ